MRLVLVTHFYPAHGGGVEKVAAQLASRMANTGVDVIWCASDVDAAPVVPGVRCEPMRSFNGVERLTGFPYPLWSPASWWRLACIVRGANAVHVHDCIYASSLVAAVFAHWYGKPLIVTQHIGLVPLPRLLRPVLALVNRLGARLVLRGARGVAFISPLVRGHFETLCGQRPQFHDVANGVDHDVFAPARGSPAGRRAALGFEAAAPLLLFVGRFASKKRLPLVRAMAAARPQWQWCVIGHGPERPEDWGLANVRVLPPMTQPELAAYYQAADLLTLPSEGEGFPLVVQEAMACGLPACITAEVAAGGAMPADLWVELPEIDGETARRGVLAIEAFLATSQEHRQARRDACAAHAARHWNWDAAVLAHLSWVDEARA